MKHFTSDSNSLVNENSEQVSLHLQIFHHSFPFSHHKEQNALHMEEKEKQYIEYRSLWPECDKVNNSDNVTDISVMEQFVCFVQFQVFGVRPVY